MSAVKKLSWGYLNYEKLAPTNATNAKKKYSVVCRISTKPWNYVYLYNSKDVMYLLMYFYKPLIFLT